jgi:UDP-glucose 4-epimerase
MAMKTLHLIIGGAGFVGSNLATSLLLSKYNKVEIIDDLSRGRLNYIEKCLSSNNCEFRHINVANYNDCDKLFSNYSFENFFEVVVWHLAANSDIPAGIDDIYVDFERTFETTVSLLAAMKKYGVKKINFASSSAIYGNHGTQPLHEDMGCCQPISNYGAMKLASEAIISAACESFLEKALIFRFPNVIGVPATHGVIYDFVLRLVENQEKLTVLGNGTQQKSYLHVTDLVVAMNFMHNNSCDNTKFQVVNIGPKDDGICVSEIAQIVCQLFEPIPEVQFGVEPRGWVGDVPKFSYNTQKITDLGWKPKLGSKEAIKLASSQILAQLKFEK